MINVTKTYLPDFDEYVSVLKRAWDKAWITNNGELLLELEAKLKEHLGVKHLLFTSNGTIVLQMALKALNITRQVITTPFSYVATTNAILWENCEPVFVDINEDDLCINADLIEAAITPATQAIMATHVYGYPCDIEKIEIIARKHNLKVIYDGAHAFDCKYKGKSLLSYGDVSTCSFHATKVFHTVEGGCLIINDDQLEHILRLYRQFGHSGDDYFSIGINGKNSEFHAAMGLCMLPKMKEIIAERKTIFGWYDELLNFDVIRRPASSKEFEYNYAYYPVVFESEEILLRVRDALQKINVTPRRYFYPSLNVLPYIDHTYSCPVSEAASLKVLSLPLFVGLEKSIVQDICDVINNETVK